MNRGDFRQLIKDELSITMTNDPFMTNDILNRFINRALHWLEDQHAWVQTQRGMKRDSEANKEDYSIPVKFKDRSIELIEFANKVYTRVSWRDYRKIKREYGDNGYTKPVVGVYEDKYFLNPMPTADGVKDIFVWGQVLADDMTDDAHTHPFTRSPRLEQAMFEYTLHLCYRKMRGSYKTDSEKAYKLAKKYSDEEWDEQKRQRTNEKTEVVDAFEHVDFLNVNGDTQRGNFKNIT